MLIFIVFIVIVYGLIHAPILRIRFYLIGVTLFDKLCLIVGTFLIAEGLRLVVGLYARTTKLAPASTVVANPASVV